MRWSDCDEEERETEKEKETEKEGGREELNRPPQDEGGKIQPNREAPEHTHSLLAYIHQDT